MGIESIKNTEPFLLYDYDGTAAGNEIQQLIDYNKLPFDTLFRLASLGNRQVDLLQDERYTLQWMMMNDMLNNYDNPENLRPDTQKLLYGERPNAVVDWYRKSNAPFYAQLDTMYYRMGHLARVIRERRADQGKTTMHKPAEWWNKEAEWSVCVGLARPLWRVLVQRTRPDLLERPNEYCPPTLSMFQVHFPGERTARRRVVGATVLSDTVVLDLYTEAAQTGVKGIGAVGRQDLRSLLGEEHPELL